MSDIYDLLTGIKLEDSSYAQLEQATERTYVDKASLEFWKGIFQVSKAQEISKTAPHGMPLPSHSGIKAASVGDGETGEVRPTGTEVWIVNAIHLDSCTMVLTDGTTSIPYSDSIDYISRTRNPIYLTNSLWIGLSNSTGSGKTPAVAYHKLSL